jgi:hypothetical protein
MLREESKRVFQKGLYRVQLKLRKDEKNSIEKVQNRVNTCSVQ